MSRDQEVEESVERFFGAPVRVVAYGRAAQEEGDTRIRQGKELRKVEAMREEDRRIIRLQMDTIKVQERHIFKLEAELRKLKEKEPVIETH